jgi:3D (Asp-Asp-Asp) domain-containing protein
MKLSPYAALALACVLLAASLCGCATLSAAGTTERSEIAAPNAQSSAPQTSSAPSSPEQPAAPEVRTVPVTYTYPGIKAPAAAAVSSSAPAAAASAADSSAAKQTLSAAKTPTVQAAPPASAAAKSTEPAAGTTAAKSTEPAVGTTAAKSAEAKSTAAPAEAPASSSAAKTAAVSSTSAEQTQAEAKAAPTGKDVPDNLVLLDTFIATAYCQTGTTATGTYTTVGRTLSVNPKIIPYGTHVWLFLDDGTLVGDYYAEDTGSNMQAHPYVVDIYMGTSRDKCIAWGARHVSIYTAG